MENGGVAATATAGEDNDGSGEWNEDVAVAAALGGEGDDSTRENMWRR